MKSMHLVAISALAAAGLVLGGCSSDPGFQPGAKKVEAKRRADGSIDDRGKCEWRGRIDREASETAGPGAVQPNVRRVYAVVGQGMDRQKVLVCREVDTNLDGVKDVVRHYNDKGESLKEEADANYDGRMDTWITYAKNRLAEVRLDNNNDGNPDEWKYYAGGKLNRVKRDGDFNTKADIWEFYRDGRLERMGVDLDGDERVDRWDHDTVEKRRLEEEERKKDETDAAAKAKKDAEENKDDSDEGEEGDAPADKSGDGPDKPAGKTTPPAKGGASGKAPGK